MLTRAAVTVRGVMAELPENSPRFLIVNYKLAHRDGRVSYVSHSLLY